MGIEVYHFWVPILKVMVAQRVACNSAVVLAELLPGRLA